jgi:hypothetical protein
MTGLLVGTEAGLWQDGRRLAEGRVADVATAPAGGWVAVVDGRVVTSDGAPAVPVPGPAATCVAALGSAAVVGTAEAHLVIVDGGQARRLESFDSAEGRDRWYTPWGGPPDTRSLAVGGDGALWVNVHVGGIVRSGDGGATWRPTIDVDADVHQVVVAGDRVVAATARGLATSADQGATWAFATEGLHGAYARAVAVAGEWLLLSASTGPYTDRSAVYRRPLAAPEGVPFERCSPWFTENIDTGLLAAAGDGTSAALAAPDGALYRSADAGASWEPAPGPPAPVTALAFA